MLDNLQCSKCSRACQEWFDCFVLWPIKSHRGASLMAVIVEFSSVLTSGPITQLTCLLTRSHYLCRTAFSLPGCLHSWGLLCKYGNRLQRFTGLLRRKIHLKINEGNKMVDDCSLHFLWELCCAKSIHFSLTHSVTTVAFKRQTPNEYWCANRSVIYSDAWWANIDFKIKQKSKHNEMITLKKFCDESPAFVQLGKNTDWQNTMNKSVNNNL